MARYRFIQNDNNVICLSSYAKRAVRGIAKCSPADEFDLETGKKLAQLRCDTKIAEKRLIRAREKYSESVDALNKALKYYDDMWEYYLDSLEQYKESKIQLKMFEEKI